MLGVVTNAPGTALAGAQVQSWCIIAIPLRQRPRQLMALECLSSHSLAEWVMDVPEQQFSAGESLEAEVIYLCTQCPAHSSAAWPCVGKHPRLPAWTSCPGHPSDFWYGCVPGEIVQRSLRLLPSICGAWIKPRGFLLVVPAGG